VELDRAVGLAANELPTSGSLEAISSAGVPCATMRPPLASSTTQSLMAMHSGTSCEITSEVAPVASLSVRMSLAATPMEIRSSPAKGSSYMISSGSSAMARASAMRRAMPPETSLILSPAAPRRPTALQLHQHDVADQGLGQIGHLAQRKGDVVEHRQVGEQRTELEQHAQAPPQAIELLAVMHVDGLAVEHDTAAVGGVHATDQAQQRRLAATRPAQHGSDLATLEAQRKVSRIVRRSS
jgi:hypothetical protein